MKSSLLRAVGGTALALLVSSAHAQDAYLIYHSEFSGPTDRCQSALPTFDVGLRKRPLAIQNEGSSTAFVTCSFGWNQLDEIGGGNVLQSLESVQIWFTNRSSSTVAVTCTAVYGRELQAITSDTRTVTIGVGLKGNLEWDDLTDLRPYKTVSMSCALRLAWDQRVKVTTLRPILLRDQPT